MRQATDPHWTRVGVWRVAQGLHGVLGVYSLLCVYRIAFLTLIALITVIDVLCINYLSICYSYVTSSSSGHLRGRSESDTTVDRRSDPSQDGKSRSPPTPSPR